MKNKCELDQWVYDQTNMPLHVSPCIKVIYFCGSPLLLRRILFHSLRKTGLVQEWLLTCHSFLFDFLGPHLHNRTHCYSSTKQSCHHGDSFHISSRNQLCLFISGESEKALKRYRDLLYLHCPLLKHNHKPQH